MTDTFGVDGCLYKEYWFGEMAMLQLLQSLPQKRRRGKERKMEKSGAEDVREESERGRLNTNASSYIGIPDR
jgi:hypothetical protein